MGVTVKELLIAVRTDMAGLKTGMATLQKETDKGKTANDNLGLSVDGVAKKLKKLAIFVGAGVLFKAAITSASDFGASIGNMSTLITDSNVNIGEMEMQFLDLAGPLGSAKELADAAYNALSASVAPGEAVQFIADTAMFAKANLIELKDAVDVTTTILNTYGSEAGTTAEIQDKLTTAIKLGKTNGVELSASLGQIAGTAKVVGISFDDLLASTVVMTAGGIKTSQAMTSLKAVISNIATPSKQASDAAEGMAGGFNLASLKAQGFSGFLKSMTDHVAGNTQKQKDLFGSIEAFNAIAVLTSKDGGQKLIDTNVALKDSADATKIAFEKQQATFASVMEGLKNQVEASIIKAVLPALRDFAGWVTDNKDKIASAFEGMAGAVGTISKALLFAIQTIPDFVTAMENAIKGQPVDPDLIYANFEDAVKAFHARMKTEFGLTTEELQKIIDSIDFGTFSGVEDLSAAEDTLRKLLTVWDEAPDFENKYRAFSKSLDPAPYIALMGAAGPIPATFKNAGEKGLFFKERLDAIKAGKYGAGLAKDWELYEKGQLKTQAAIEAGTTAIEVQAPALKKLNSEMVTYISKLGLLSAGDITEAKKQIDFLSAAFLSDTAEAEANRKQLVLNEGALKNVTKEVQGIIDKFKSMSMEVPPQAQALADKIASLGVSADLAGDHMEELDTDFLDGAKSMEDFAGEAELLPPIIGDMGEETVVLGGTLEDLMEDLDAANKIFSSFAGILGDTTGAMDTFISVVGGIGDFAAGFAMGDPVAMASGLLTVIGSIADVVGSTDWAGYAQAEAKALGISSEMGDRLASLAEEMGSVNGALFVMMDEIIASENIKGQDDFLKWLNEISRMLGKVARGGDLSELNDAVAALGANAADIGFLGREFQKLISDADALGISIDAATELMDELFTIGVDGYKAMKGALDDTDLVAEIDALNKEMLKMEPASDEFLNAATKLDDLETKLKSVRDAQEVFGDVSIGVFDKIIEKEELFATIDPLLTAIGGWEDAMIQFANTSETILVKDFTDFSNIALDEFNKLIEAGVSEKDALELLEPQLATLIGLSNDYGFAIDEETQALIDKGRQAGLNFEEEKSADEQIIGLLERIVKVFEVNLPDALETFGDAGETVFGKYQDWIDLTANNLSGLAGSFPDDLPFNGGGGSGPGAGGGEPGFASGTGGMFIPTPKSFRVGETGLERIETSGGRMRVTPLGGGGGDDGGKTTQIFNFNISTIDGPSTEKFMREQAMPIITRSSRTGNFTMHKGALVN